LVYEEERKVVRQIYPNMGNKIGECIESCPPIYCETPHINAATIPERKIFDDKVLAD
jgi:hypothetical protein